MSTDSASTLIDESLAAFMESGVSVIVGGRSADNVPNLVRASGCRLSPDRKIITVFVAMSHAGGLIASLRENGVIAVVFSRPSTHQSIQFKGRDARIAPLLDGDWARISLYRESLVHDIVSVGYPQALIRTMLTVEREDMVAVSFTPHALFEQTPGPDAGKLIGSTA